MTYGDVYQVVGNVYEDVWHRFPDGLFIHTSVVRSHAQDELKEGMIITTINSTYLLGKEGVL